MDSLNSTISSNQSSTPEYVGYIAILITCLGWGSLFLPVKKFETGDGLFYQLFMCIGIWTVSYVVNWIRGFPTFYALPILCGVTWSIGNVTSVPIIKFVGMSLGQTIWGVTALVVGWGSARFGWFGSKPQEPKIIWMNYVGAALAAFSGIFYVFVKSEVSVSGVQKTDTIEIKDLETTNSQKSIIETEHIEKSFIDTINPKLKRIIGISLSIFSGIMYGLNYVPILYIIDNYEGASTNDLDYLYSFCSGTLISSIIFLLIYCIVKKNKPIVYANVILPGFIAGCIWGIANACFLIASTSLSQAVVFPIGMSGPPMVATLYGILIFKEIRGKRNLIILGVGFLFTIVGSLLSGLSR